MPPGNVNVPMAATIMDGKMNTEKGTRRLFVMISGILFFGVIRYGVSQEFYWFKGILSYILLAVEAVAILWILYDGFRWVLAGFADTGKLKASKSLILTASVVLIAVYIVAFASERVDLYNLAARWKWRWSRMMTPPTVISPGRQTVPDWRDVSLWHKVRNGMSKNEVRTILGEPSRITERYTGSQWVYGPVLSGPRVNFDFDGRAQRWSDPDNVARIDSMVESMHVDKLDLPK